MTRAADLAKLIAGGGSITVDDNASVLSLVSTDADANSGPVQVLYRNSSSPADSDLVGEMHFRGRNDNSQDVEYVTISTRMEDVSDGTEDGKIILKTMVDGTARSRIEIDHTDVVINQDSIDSNFRVESNNQAGMIFVDAGNDRVGIGTVSPNHDLHLHKSTSDGNFLLITNSTTGSNNNDGAAIGLAADETLLIYHQESSDIRFGTASTERMRITSGGELLFGTTTAPSGGSVHMVINSSSGGGIQLTRNNSGGSVIDAIDGGGARFFTFSGAVGSESYTERMRIDSSGNLLVHKTSANHTDVGHVLFPQGGISIVRDGSQCAVLNRLTDDGTIIDFRKDGSTVGNISTGPFRIFATGVNNGGWAFSDGAGILPMKNQGLADNSMDLGASSNRMDDIFATNGTIQTSDQNEKQDIASATAKELNVAKKLSTLFKTFRWKDKVIEKGDKARTHTGIVAQEVQSAFKAEGLDASNYGLFTSDTWTNDDGKEQTRLGVRYPELFSFIFSSIEARLTALESK